VASGELSSRDNADLKAYQQWSRDFNAATARIDAAIDDCVDAEFLSSNKQTAALQELQSAAQDLYRLAIDINIVMQVAPKSASQPMWSGMSEL
jgi:hypothetical protein